MKRIDYQAYRYKFYYQSKYKIEKAISYLMLHKYDKRNVPDKCGEIRLFAKIKNEALRLPYFLKYYLEKGVDRIFLIDNCSTDNTLSLTHQYKNIHIFQTNESFTKHWNWIEILLEKYGKGHWCIVVDADELFYYPYAEKLSLRHLIKYMERERMTAIMCLLLDMYSKKPINKAVYESGENPLSVCPYFDTHYVTCNIKWFNYKAWKIFKTNGFIGGVRYRVFGPVPCLISKVPLFKYSDSTYLRKDVHAISNAEVSDIQGVIFHNKFFSDFIELCEVHAKREEYYNKSIVYKVYLEKIKNNPDLSLYHENSVKFKDSKQLIELGIMKSSQRFENFVANVD